MPRLDRETVQNTAACCAPDARDMHSTCGQQAVPSPPPIQLLRTWRSVKGRTKPSIRSARVAGSSASGTSSGAGASPFSAQGGEAKGTSAAGAASERAQRAAPPQGTLQRWHLPHPALLEGNPCRTCRPKTALTRVAEGEAAAAACHLAGALGRALGGCCRKRLVSRRAAAATHAPGRRRRWLLLLALALGALCST